MLLTKINELELAVELFTKSIELDPYNIWNYISIGNTLHTLGKFDQAIEYYNKAIAIDPNSEALYNNIKSSTKGY